MVESNQSRFDTSHALRLFPTFVWKADLKREISQRINADILNSLADMRRSLPKLQPGQAWQSDQALHRFDEFREFVAGINEVATNVLDHLKIGYDAFEITACRANVSAPGAEHRIHSHPNNFLSGVYYAKTHEGADTSISRSEKPNRDHQATGDGTDRREHRSSRCESDGRNASRISSLAATLRRWQPWRWRKNKHQFQHYVFCIHGKHERATLGSPVGRSRLLICSSGIRSVAWSDR